MEPRRECAASVRAHASDLVMLDVVCIGGITGWLRAAAIAEAAGLKISPRAFPEFSVHPIAAAPTPTFRSGWTQPLT